MNSLKLKLLWVGVGITALAGVWAGKAAFRASQDLVTLNVRDLDVRKVIAKIERQTWETVVYPSSLKGKVTLNVRNAPLREVLDMVAGQVSARASHIYPIYQQKKSLRELHTLLQNLSTNQQPNGVWTNFFGRGRFGMGRPFGGPEGMMEEPTNSLLSLNLVGQDSAMAARQLSASRQGRVVLADGLAKPIFLFVTNASLDLAAGKLAGKLNARVDDFYLLQTMEGGRDGGPRFRPGGGETNQLGDPSRRPPPEMIAARLAELTPEQRARMEEMRNLTPEDRQARMQARMEDPAVQQRMSDRMLKDLRSATPEQIVQQKRERMRRMPGGPRGTNGPGFGPGNPGGPRRI